MRKSLPTGTPSCLLGKLPPSLLTSPLYSSVSLSLALVYSPSLPGSVGGKRSEVASEGGLESVMIVTSVSR